MIESAPMPDATAVQFVDGIDEDAESREPCERDDDVNCGRS